MLVERKVAVLVGSLRKGSFSRRAAETMVKAAPDHLLMSFVEIRDLPHYDQDLDDEGNPPEQWVVFRDAVATKDAVLFVTPEYNRSVPGFLKNAIDVGSRPGGASVWNGKPAAVVSISPGALGGFGANHHLRQSLVFLNMPVLQQPEAYIGKAASLFGGEGGLSDAGSAEFLRTFMSRFSSWIELILR